jgi:hypothetical protein
LAFSMVEKVPRLRRLPVFGFFLREYNRYSPDFSFRIISPPQYSVIEMIAGKERAAFSGGKGRNRAGGNGGWYGLGRITYFLSICGGTIIEILAGLTPKPDPSRCGDQVILPILSQ